MLQTSFTSGGKTYVRNSGSGGVDVEVSGVRITHWAGPDGEQLTGETRWLNGKPSLRVIEGDERLYRELEKMFWATNVGELTLGGTKKKTGPLQ